MFNKFLSKSRNKKTICNKFKDFLERVSQISISLQNSHLFSFKECVLFDRIRNKFETQFKQ